ncbi:P-loop containing nucleoside triphosphate hydrolase protein [Mariannaea sp. PMI_226]|nr:P-loop containing nucleoside triphosphate hydrolase protein [Mariannaea sp. PMI_226]
MKTDNESSKNWYTDINPLRWGDIPKVPEEREVSPEYRAGFLSRLTFQWMTGLMTTGYKRRIEREDIWAINPDRAVEPWTKKVHDLFQQHIREGRKHPLFRALLRTFYFEFWLSGFYAILCTILRVVSAFTLRFLIQFAVDAYNTKAGEPTPSIRRGIGLAIGITLMMIVQGFAITHSMYCGEMVGGQTRSVLVGMIYKKSLVVSTRAKTIDIGELGSRTHDSEMENCDLAETTGIEENDSPAPVKEENKGQPGDGIRCSNGRIVNLMSVDTHRIDKASAMFHMTWTSPVSVLMVFIFLFINISYSALPGFGLLVLGMPILSMVIRRMCDRRQDTNNTTAERISLTQEFLQSIRTVKYFGLEEAILRRLRDLRSSEIQAIRNLLVIGGSLEAVGILLPILASMLSFIVYSHENPNLAPAEVFSALALFNSLRIPLKIFPIVLGQVMEAWSSLRRIEEFLMEPEHLEYVVRKPTNQAAIILQNASFSWETCTNEHNSMGTNESDEVSPPDNWVSSLSDEKGEGFNLQNLNLNISQGELIAVIGSVGSGKSSLLAALAGEMHMICGEATVNSSTSFCPQCPWIQNTTVRNNITFGTQMEEQRYKDVITACALQTDLDILPDGDQTEVGERGVTISGGQKQRLSLARAIYFDADIALLDDPLSAVDTHVGRYIFHNAILGLLGKKCRILVTQQLWVLGHCDRIAWMDGGKIRTVDTFENLMRDCAEFRKLIEGTITEETPPESTTNALSGISREGEEKENHDRHVELDEAADSVATLGHYGAYIRAAGSISIMVLLPFLLVLAQGAAIMTSLWLAYWTSKRFHLLKWEYIVTYIGIGVLQALFMFVFSVLTSILGANASKAMLYSAYTRILRTPTSFFDTTPLGKIMSRFTHDADIIDNEVSSSIRIFLFTLAMVFSVFGVIIAFFNYFAIALAPLAVLFVISVLYYRSSARELHRLDSSLQSQMFAKFNEGLGGATSIRSYGVRELFIGNLLRTIDEMNSAYYLTFSSQHWLTLRLNMIGNAIIFTVSILVVTSRFSVNPSFGGLVLSYILTVVQILQYTPQQLAQVENGMRSVKRIHDYSSRLEVEAPLHTIKVPQTWPERGEIAFEEVYMRYRKDLPLVLKGFSMRIQSGERIGIVGRTGAGKSSIINALFRVVELSSGKIIVDGMDISSIGLHDLRSRLSIIPQDSTLFQGTIRSNIDPYGQYTESELCAALREVYLTNGDRSPDRQNATDNFSQSHLDLDSVVEENGQNLSLGQRQLVAFSRALLRRSQVILCDEATSSVDVETEKMIQRALVTAFQDKTVLFIAHRMHSIIGYDRICVVDEGRVAELSTPIDLWCRGGVFRSMCDQSGIGMSELQAARAEILKWGEKKDSM